MGAAMMAPDYTWWHGIYDVAHNFYFKFLPSARDYGVEIEGDIDRLLSGDSMHTWLNKTTEELKASIRSGEHQQTYRGLFRGPPAATERSPRKGSAGN
ncbi:MAG: hypothetical protein HQ559_11385, partial [Lentisphaerae bacterium]|nr:hypothetical protein [Lentisphaerota bacterium]